MSTLKIVMHRFKQPAPIHLDLRRSALFTQSRLVAIAILCMAIIYGLYCYGLLTKQISQKALRIEQEQQKIQELMKPLNLNPAEESALQKALKIIDYPWPIPFQLIESAASENVTLIEVQSDIEKRENRISAQTTDLTSMFDYAKKLKKAAHVRRVTLNSEEIQDDDIQPILFTITVSW
jgi:cell division protein FtsL